MSIARQYAKKARYARLIPCRVSSSNQIPPSGHFYEVKRSYHFRDSRPYSQHRLTNFNEMYSVSPLYRSSTSDRWYCVRYPRDSSKEKDEDKVEAGIESNSKGQIKNENNSKDEIKEDNDEEISGKATKLENKDGTESPYGDHKKSQENDPKQQDAKRKENKTSQSVPKLRKLSWFAKIESWMYFRRVTNYWGPRAFNEQNLLKGASYACASVHRAASNNELELLGDAVSDAIKRVFEDVANYYTKKNQTFDISVREVLGAQISRMGMSIDQNMGEARIYVDVELILKLDSRIYGTSLDGKASDTPDAETEGAPPRSHGQPKLDNNTNLDVNGETHQSDTGINVDSVDKSKLNMATRDEAEKEQGVALSSIPQDEITQQDYEAFDTSSKDGINTTKTKRILLDEHLGVYGHQLWRFSSPYVIRKIIEDGGEQIKTLAKVEVPRWRVESVKILL